MFLFCTLFISLLACRSTKVDSPLDGHKAYHLVYLNIYKGGSSYPLHVSVLIEPNNRLRSLNNYQSLDSLLCDLYGSGFKFYDGSSINFTRYDSLSRKEVQTEAYVSQLNHIYENLLEEKKSFPSNNIEVLIQTARALVKFDSQPFKEEYSDNWLTYEYQVPQSCLKVDSIYFLTKIERVYSPSSIFQSSK